MPIVDVHAHYNPRVYADKLQQVRGPRRGTGASQVAAVSAANEAHPYNDTQEQIEGRLALMDDAGVAVQVLSPAGAAPYSNYEAMAIEAAKVCNDSYASLVARYPARFKQFVSLPLPHIGSSLREMARGMDELGCVGVAMNCSVFDRSSAEEEFEPLYQEMNRRGAVLFYHPVQNGICSPMINDYKFTVSVGASLEDSAIVLHLIARRIPERYPNIKFIVPHFGGIIGMLLNRLDNQAAPQHPTLAELPSITARRFYYDTVGHGSQAALLCAWEAFGASHLVTGSDYPVLLSFETYKETFDYIRHSSLPQADKDAILEHNAAQLLGLSV